MYGESSRYQPYSSQTAHRVDTESIYESIVPPQQFTQFSNPIYTHMDNDTDTKYSNILQSDSFIQSPSPKIIGRKIHVQQVQSKHVEVSFQDGPLTRTLWQRLPPSNPEPTYHQQYEPNRPPIPPKDKQSVVSQYEDRPSEYSATTNRFLQNRRELSVRPNQFLQQNTSFQDMSMMQTEPKNHDTSFGYQHSIRSKSSNPLRDSVRFKQSQFKGSQYPKRNSITPNYMDPLPPTDLSRVRPIDLDSKQSVRNYGSFLGPKQKQDFRQSANYNACSLF